MLKTIYCFQQSDDSSNVLYHPPHFKGPIMFSFRAKVFFGKKKSCIKVKKGEWSDKFSLDVAGSSGVVNCKADNTTYEVNLIDRQFLFLIVRLIRSSHTEVILLFIPQFL